MQCRSVLTRIDALRTGEIDRAEEKEVERHIESCSSCNKSVDDVRSFATLIKSVKATPPRSCVSDVKRRCCDSFGSFEVDGHIVWVGFSSNGVKRIDLRSKDAEEFRRSYGELFDRSVEPAEVPKTYVAAITAALRGSATKLPDLDLSDLSDFEQEVLRTIAKIPRGEVRSYEWVARAVNRPKAIRAVGNVMATNPLPFILPCHRVVPTEGGVGSYYYGPEMKKELLKAEGTPVDELESLAKRGVRYIGSRTSKIFCFPTCKDARRIREENKVAFRNASQAEQEGFRPCKRCAPVAMSA